MGQTKKNKKIKMAKKSKNISNRIPEIIVKKILTDKYMKNKEGDYFDNKHYDKIIDYDYFHLVGIHHNHNL